MSCLLTLLVVILALGIDFLLTTGIYWVVCWAFGLTFTWPIALAVWLITILIAGIIRSGRNNK